MVPYLVSDSVRPHSRRLRLSRVVPDSAEFSNPSSQHPFPSRCYPIELQVISRETQKLISRRIRRSLRLLCLLMTRFASLVVSAGVAPSPSSTPLACGTALLFWLQEEQHNLALIPIEKVKTIYICSDPLDVSSTDETLS